MAAFCDVTTTNVQVQTTIGTPEIIFNADAPIVLPEPGLFVRACSGLGSSYAIVKGNNTSTGEIYLISRAGVVTAAQGASYGNQCCAIVIVGTQVMGVWQDSTTTYKSRLYSNLLVPAGAASTHSIPTQFINTSQGMTDVTAAGVPIWTDSYARPYVVKGLPLFFPAERGGYWIGQGGGTLAAQICGVAPNGRTFTLYLGDAYEPHISAGAAGVFYVATRTATAGPFFTSFTATTLPAFQGSITGGSGGNVTGLGTLGNKNLYPPKQHPVADTQAENKMTVPWANWADTVSETAAQALSTANANIPPAGLTPAVPGVPGGGVGGGITLTGDVTGGPSVSTIATTIATNIVSNTKFRQSVGVSVVGRSANSTGNVADIAAASNGQVLKRASNALSFAAVDLTADVAGRLPYANLVAATAASRILVRTSGSAGDWQEGTLDSTLVLTGTVLGLQSGLMRVRTSWTNAQIKASPTTPLVLVAAPGAGFRIIWIQVDIRTSLTAAYTNVDAAGYAVLAFGVNEVGNYIGNDGATSPVLTDYTDLFNTNAVSSVQMVPYSRVTTPAVTGWGNAAEVKADIYENTALSFVVNNNGAGDLTGGNAANVLVANVYCAVQPL